MALEKLLYLNVISTIDKVTAGHIYIDGKDITKLKGSSLINLEEKIRIYFPEF